MIITFNSIINVFLLISFYSYIFIFSLSLLINYIINDNWNAIIPELGNNTIKRVLMLSHIILGIVCMILYPVQRLMKKTNHKRHFLIGIFLVTLTIITSIMGNIYIYLYGTIGGLFMSISFSIGGSLLFIFSTIVASSGYFYRKYQAFLNKLENIKFSDLEIQIEPENKDQNSNKKIHLLAINIYGAIIYSSLFYRQLYFNAYIFGYQVPLQSSDYSRPLDRIFQIIYYLLPIFFMVFYTIINKKFRLISKISLLIYSLYILSATILAIYSDIKD